MASVYDYTFDNLSRAGDDMVTNSEKNKQNQHFGLYSVTNYFNNEKLEHPVAFATRQPNINVHGGKNSVGMNGHAVDYDSQLKIGSEQASSVGRLNLLERQFLTVPYLGKGPVRVDDETRLLQGDNNTNRRSVNGLSEESYIQYSNYPLIDSIRKTVNNPKNLVEGAASKNWVRGGECSRDP